MPDQRLPHWFKIRPPSGENFQKIRRMVSGLKLATVCQEARCPNLSECWSGGTATFMVMGDTCTRGCRFCHVATGNPKGALDPLEPQKVADSVENLGLTYTVITSVDRDDLPDGGADHFGRVIEAIREQVPDCLVEVLIPDFAGDEASLDRVIAAGPHVIAHNIETVRRLTPRVRDRRAAYDQSLDVLRHIKKASPDTYTKSSIMLGLGETDEEVETTLDDLKAADVSVVTFGQYLRPSKEERFLPVEEYVHPDKFDEWARIGMEEKKFLYVASGPLVRSSYRAGEFFLEGLLRNGRPPPTDGPGSAHGASSHSRSSLPRLPVIQEGQ
ncbi:MAG: lipoyl synthase [Euryarchaeota archaeon]|nr:lipoyl synthase [Euryarchaeota archaeon]